MSEESDTLVQEVLKSDELTEKIRAEAEDVISDHDFSDEVDQAVENALDNHDFSEDATRALDDYDFSEVVGNNINVGDILDAIRTDSYLLRKMREVLQAVEERTPATQRAAAVAVPAEDRPEDQPAPKPGDGW